MTIINRAISYSEQSNSTTWKSMLKEQSISFQLCNILNPELIHSMQIASLVISCIVIYLLFDISFADILQKLIESLCIVLVHWIMVWV